MSQNEKPKVIKTEVVYKNFFQIKKEQIEIPERGPYDYYSLVADPFAVMVIATTAYNEYVLNWEYRHPTGQTLLSCPGGIMHDNEEPLTCAERELLEETGYTAENFELIGESYPFPGICPQKTYFVRAYNAVQSQPQNLDRSELIQTELFTHEKLKKKLNGKTPLDGLLLTALFFASAG